MDKKLDFSQLGFKEDEKKQLSINVETEELKGRYANVMQITHTQEEFILDFFLAVPPQGTLISRVVMNPSHFRRMVKDVFGENLKKYEEKFGDIKRAEKNE